MDVSLRGLLAFSTAAPLCSHLTNLSYPLPLLRQTIRKCALNSSIPHSNISVKPTSSLGVNTNNYGTFFVWTQRLGYVPSVEQTLKDATAKGDIIVIINPTQSFTETDVHLLTTFLENGGQNASHGQHHETPNQPRMN